MTTKAAPYTRLEIVDMLISAIKRYPGLSADILQEFLELVPFYSMPSLSQMLSWNDLDWAAWYDNPNYKREA
jgi:hypothetical protein